VLKIRLVHLQSLLVDLVDLLDEEQLLGAGGGLYGAASRVRSSGAWSNLGMSFEESGSW